MTLTIAAEPIPLEQDEHGTIRVKGSRVTLDTIIAAYNKGETPEQIQEGFDTLALGDIYAIIGYYLHYQSEVEKYLAAQDVKAAEIWQKIKAHSKNGDIRERLLARLAAQQTQA